jgi:hypothetical protein
MPGGKTGDFFHNLSNQKMGISRVFDSIHCIKWYKPRNNGSFNLTFFFTDRR